MTESKETPRRTYNSKEAAELMFRGYLLGVIAPITGSSQHESRLYAATVNALMPKDIKPYFEKIVSEKLNPLVNQMNTGIEEAVNKSSKRPNTKK